MKVLLSAFACLPNAGSEGGVGWRYAMQWAREHEVVVITDISRRAAIEAELAHQPLANPRFVYFRPWWLRRVPLNSATAQVLYQLWQIALLPFVRRLQASERFDLAHHVSYGVFRQPSLIGHAGIPLVFGPVGGGEDAPAALKRSLAPLDRLREAVRALLNRFARIDPLLRFGLAGCALILAKTGATARALPGGFQRRTEVALEVGTVQRAGVQARKAPAGRPLRLLYAGRLLGLKGLHLGLAALARARAKGADVELTLVGNGPYENRLRRQATRLGLGQAVHWFGPVPQDELFALYRQADAVLFPSLHDSSGNVVVEALSFALPVICLDLGGPADIVTDASGCVIRTDGLGEAGVIAGLADAIAMLSCDSSRYEHLSAGALARAGELDWGRQMARIQRLALACVRPAGAVASQAGQAAGP
jgi:glycosyltransferase involved in cell wall biosynthesis